MAAAAIPLIIAGVAAVGKMSTAQSEAKTEGAILNMKATQEAMAATQRMSNRVDNMNQVLGAQAASAAVRGIDMGSTSFKAVEKDSFDRFLQDKNSEALNQQFRDSNLLLQLNAVRNKEAGSMFEALGSFGMSYASMMRTGAASKAASSADSSAALSDDDTSYNSDNNYG